LNIPKSADEIIKNYKLSDNKGPYREIELRNTHREFGEHNRPNLFYSFYIDQYANISLTQKLNTIMVEPIWDDGFRGCWTWGKDKAKREIDNLIVKKIKGKWKVYRKNYSHGESNEANKQVKSVWNDKCFYTEKGQGVFNKLFKTKDKIFQSPKSIEIIKQTLLMGTDSDSLIVDFFAGSSTTSHAVMDLNREDNGNRKYIMIQIPENTDNKSEAYKLGYSTISKISKERIRRAGSRINEENPEYKGDTGFKVFKLDQTNINQWDANYETLTDALNFGEESIKSDRTEYDVLYEILLKYGLDLSYPVQEHIIADKTVFNVAYGSLIVCLADNITMEAIEGIATLVKELDSESTRVVFKDSGFNGNDAMKTNAMQILKQHSTNEVKSI